MSHRRKWPRLLAAAAAASLLWSGCATALPMAGYWVGEKDIVIPPSEHSEIDETMKRVELTVGEDGEFTLVDKSIPYQGRLDTTSKTQSLQIETAAGMPVGRMPANSRPTYTLVWLGNDAMRVEGAGTEVVLHRKAKPPTG